MLGGTERLGLRLAGELSRLGHEATLRGGAAGGTHDGVRFVPTTEVVGTVDAVVCVQTEPPPDVCAAVRIAWSHAAQWPLVAEWDAIVVSSRYHAEVLRSRLPGVPVDVISPGIDSAPETDCPRDRFLYASSPDRGLHRLLALWPTLWREFGVPLSIAYDARAVFARYRGGQSALSVRLREVEAGINQPGVVVHGALTDAQLGQLRARSLALLYPLDPVLPHSELLSLAVREACAAGCPPILAPVDAFPSEYGGVARLVEPGGACYDAAAWVAAIREVLGDQLERSAAARVFAAAHGWDTWVDGWRAVLTRRPQRPRSVVQARQEWIIVVGGERPADSALAHELAVAAAERGHGLHIFAREGADIELLDGPWRLEPAASLGSIIAAVATGADRIVLCTGRNLHSLLDALANLPRLPPVVSLDGSPPEWLDHLPGAVVVRLALVAWPQRALECALDGPSPLFRLSPGARARVRAVGWLPPSPNRDRQQDHGCSDIAPDGAAELAALAAFTQVGLLSGSVCGGGPSLSGILVCRPEDSALGHARANGTPVSVLAPGHAFGTEPYCEADRMAQALFLSGEVEIIHEDLPAEGRARGVRLALRQTVAPSGDGAVVAVQLVESLTDAPEFNSLPELRP